MVGRIRTILSIPLASGSAMAFSYGKPKSSDLLYCYGHFPLHFRTYAKLSGCEDYQRHTESYHLALQQERRPYRTVGAVDRADSSFERGRYSRKMHDHEIKDSIKLCCPFVPRALRTAQLLCDNNSVYLRFY